MTPTRSPQASRQLLTLAEAGARLGLATKTMRVRISRREIAHVKLCKSPDQHDLACRCPVRIPVEAVERLISIGYRPELRGVANE